MGWKFISEHEQALGQRFLDGLPDSWTLHGPQTMEGRVTTFTFTLDGIVARARPAAPGRAGFALWPGNYYALEVMRHSA